MPLSGYVTELPMRTLAFRASIIIGLVSAVATVLYFTPLPDQYPQSCSRSCHELDWPMICRVKLTLERYQTLSRACGDCPRNATDCYGKHCVAGDGERRGILTVNRQFPGPNLRVCQNDIIVVDVVNRVPGQSFGVHWRGQSQIESPHMDGVPMITQCPIPSFTTFQYKFRANHAGTHMWQINAGEEFLETLFGAFIVRKPDSRETHRDLYDVEDPDHVLTVHTLSSSRQIPNWNPATKLMINGKGDGMPPANFKVVTGTKYRFRLIMGGDTDGCRVRVSVDDHEMTVFALDGNPIRPKKATSVVLAPGERLDFVLRADRPPSTYAVRATPYGSCKGVTEAIASLRYDGTESASPVRNPVAAIELSTVSDGECENGKSRMRVCPEQMESLTPIPKGLLVPNVKHKFYLFYAVRSVSSQTIYNTTFIAVDDTVKIPQANNLTMTFPPSPLLTQAKDVTSLSFCNAASVPKACADRPGDVCECIHTLPVKLGEVVEVVLVNQDEDKVDHTFHLHGYNFHMIGSTVLKKSLTPEEIKSLDGRNELLARNYNNPIVKDTVAVPFNGVTVLRFKADNPGYWLLDDEHSSNWSRGMAVVIRVGRDSDVPNAPKDFPRCGDWIGPEYFLE